MQITKTEREVVEKAKRVRAQLHFEKMAWKKEQRSTGAITAGFTPSPQPRTDGKIAMLTTVNMGKGMDQEGAYRAAVRELLPTSHVQPFQKSIVHMHRRMQKQNLARLKREQARLEAKEAA